MTPEPDHDLVVDDLPALLRGELDRDALRQVIDHLERCPQCQGELVDQAGANAAILTARRTLGEAAIPGQPGASAGPSAPGGPQDQPLPDLPRPSRRRRMVVAVIGGVAAACLAGVVAVTVLRDDEPPPAQVQQAALSPVGGQGSGQVTMSTPQAGPTPTGTQMTIRTVGLQPASTGTYYYAWLFDPATNKMLALGVVGPDGTATFTLDPSLVREYHAVDVSLQEDNGNPAHSTQSVLRGQY